jgi:mono/diheme cytochrome c family protein
MTMNSLPVFALVALVLASCARSSAGVSGAEPSPPGIQHSPGSASAIEAAGRSLFLKNCALCHGASAHGDEGPDLHNLDFSDQWIANRIRNGKKGEMTAFGGKLRQAEIDSLIAYLHTLK